MTLPVSLHCPDIAEQLRGGWRAGQAKSGARLATGLDLGSELGESEPGKPLVGSFYYVKICLEDLKG
jgi:hypothetical protein